ncbi:MAG TPA: hypothetical protein VGR90_10700 [Acidimicrobiales bacterium]|nr:hypothetical protein [Acidimicrobiales bacterium]
MGLATQNLQPADQPEVNRLVVGEIALKIEHLEPLGDVSVDTPSGRFELRRAASVACRCRSGEAVYLFGETDGGLVGAQSA